MNDTPLQIACPHCTAINRLPPSRLGDAPACGKCHRPLFTGVPLTLTSANFDQHAQRSELPLLIDFWAPWCGPCRMVAPVLDKLAGEFAGQIKIAKVDVDANPGLSQAFRIQSIPNLMIVKNRTMIFNQPGALPETAMRQLIEQAIALEVPTPEQQQQQPTAGQ